MIGAGAAGGAGFAKWLGLAASPTFAAMALLTSLGSDPMMLCSAAAGIPLGGMAPMYLLMSVFHAAPWLKLFGEGPSRAEHSR